MSPPPAAHTTSIPPALKPALAALGLILLAVLPARSAIAAAALDSTVMVRWEAPADDASSSSTGSATLYELRFRTTPVTDGDSLGWWNGANRVMGMPVPGAPGSSESVVIGRLDPAFTYYFILRAADEVPNWSAYSNVLVRPALIDTTPPAAIHDLNVVSD